MSVVKEKEKKMENRPDVKHEFGGVTFSFIFSLPDIIVQDGINPHTSIAERDTYATFVRIADTDHV